MNQKTNIRYLEKTFNYLANPDLRQRELSNNVLVIRDAEISGVNFIDLSWTNLHFINCDFIGAYQIKLKSLRHTTFEDCRFAGVVSWGIANALRYFRCKTGGRSIVLDYSGSSNVLFEDCDFVGPDSDPNHWGGIGSRGDATFIKCRMKWFSLAGYEQINLEGCETADVKIWTDSKANSGEDYFSSSVKIESSKLRGKFDMAASDLQSVTIKDTYLDFLDLSGAEIKNDVLIERVRGGYLNASAHSMGKLTISQCQILGRRKNFSFEVGMDSAEEVLIEHCNFGTDPTLSVGLGAGRPLEPNEWSTTPKNKYALIRNSTLPVMDASWLESRHLRLENNTIGSVDISNSRIGKLELSGNTISREVNLKGTHVKESKIQPLTKSQAKLDGSNIKLN
ncbi:hypothetical protein [uncultured Pseudacidovorax sp.]|uniref:hypothetical protein n=1 Tax=uncultured Pseudacidovorax sp. TaxID=679313 RepID=UPI0025EA9507|nr:hypothetical protein [uncultured Pseudacidovorax sp.]